MIVRAPARRAPWTTLSPTPPHPITTTDAPASTRAQRVTAPTPVGTAQPISAACGQGISLAIGTSISAGHTTDSANVPRRAIWLMSCLGAHDGLGKRPEARHLVDVLPVAVRRWVPSSMTKRGEV